MTFGRGIGTPERPKSPLFLLGAPCDPHSKVNLINCTALIGYLLSLQD